MTTAENQSIGRYAKWLISAAVLVHLSAVILPPLAFQARSPAGLSDLVGKLVKPVEGYGQFLYVDRGYAFFAPDPGPSHLFQAMITSPDGASVERMFPDLDDHWPRLLYHRHFMLSEYLEEIYQPPGPPRELFEIDKTEAELWAQARSRYEHVRRAYVDHLRSQYPNHDVAIRRIEHLIPDRESFQQESIQLNDERLYQVLLDQPIDLGSELGDEGQQDQLDANDK